MPGPPVKEVIGGTVAGRGPPQHEDGSRSKGLDAAGRGLHVVLLADRDPRERGGLRLSEDDEGGPGKEVPNERVEGGGPDEPYLGSRGETRVKDPRSRNSSEAAGDRPNGGCRGDDPDLHGREAPRRKGRI